MKSVLLEKTSFPFRFMYGKQIDNGSTRSLAFFTLPHLSKLPLFIPALFLLHVQSLAAILIFWYACFTKVELPFVYFH